MISITKYLEQKALSVLGLLPALAPLDEEKTLFINDLEEAEHQRIVEYGTWYDGDSDNILALYNYDVRITFNTEPFYWKNKRSYFWSRASLENDIKRTHSGFPRDFVDTLVCICGTPIYKVNCPEPPEGQEPQKPLTPWGVTVEDALASVLDANEFWSLYRRDQMPMTLAKGWGGYKITWDVDVYGPEPVISFYQAENVKIWKRGNRVLGMCFLDWYKDAKGTRYLVAETRVMKGGRATFVTDVFVDTGSGNLRPVSGSDDLRVPASVVTDMPCLMAVPCSFYSDHLHGMAGKSVFAGKIDLLDDLDQALSQESNTVRRSTPVETFDMDYAERDPRSKLPKLPSLFERRYVAIQGQRNALGEAMATKPVEVTQPQLNTQLYDSHIDTLKRAIIGGHLSPSAMGLDFEHKDNADAEREKDKVTIFTRNHLTKEEQRILTSLFNQAMSAKEYLATGQITKTDWGIEVAFDEFSNISFETKIKTMSTVLANGGVSPQMYVDKVYGNSISEEMKKKESDWLDERMKANQPAPEEGMGPEDMGIDPDAMDQMGDDAVLDGLQKKSGEPKPEGD